MNAGRTLDDVLAFVVTLGIAALALWFLVTRLTRHRRDLRIGVPVASALVLRVLMAAAVSLTSYGTTLRGGDEIAFRFAAQGIDATPFLSTEWIDALTRELHIFIIAVQDALLNSPEMALRVTEAAIWVGGTALLAAAVYELAGPRAARISMWALALEPSGVFFGTLIHKESLVMLAIGLVTLGAAKMWRRGELSALLPMAAGVGIAAATRGYVSWFLIIAAAATTMHAGLRGLGTRSARSLVGLSAVAILVAITIPVLTGKFTDDSLHQLDVSQRANANDNSNLQLEAVDFSSGTGIITNLPTRLREVTFRPYPWELDNTSQRLGLLGTLVVLVSLYLIIRGVLANRGRVMELAGPLIYVGLSLLVAYSLTAGNAGTAFRYRTQIVAVVLCLVVILELARARVAEAERKRPTGPAATPGAPEPALGTLPNPS